MIKINDYENYILRSTPLNDSELNDVLKYEGMVYQSKIYEDDITNEAVNKVKDSYDETILKASLLDPENKGPNVDPAIQRNNQMQLNLEQIKQTRSNDNNMVLTRTKKDPMSFSAGFTNASVIIFVVLLVGIIASVVLLSLS